MESLNLPSLSSTAKELGIIVGNTKEPVIIKEVIDCELTRWDLEQWKLVLGSQMLKFRCGQNAFTKEPQWESTCSMKESNFESFLKHIQSNTKEWQYFDYKHLDQWITESETLQEKIDWSALGFPAINYTNTTIWIGSKGAHTLCHKDTYSCNIVLQVFGRKEWLLFPPDENLKPTRIPFEESTVFSKFNFFSPVPKEFKGLTGCRKIILNPGDVLVVPNKWWHYVENLDTAISINTWIPLPEDDFERIKEGVASIFVETIGNLFNGDYLVSILNPNMTSEMLTSEDNLQTLNLLTKVKLTEKCQEEELTRKAYTTCDVQSLLDKYSTKVFKIPVLTDYEFESFLIQQTSRFNSESEFAHELDVNAKTLLNNFLEVITDDDVLTLIARKLVKSL